MIPRLFAQSLALLLIAALLALRLHTLTPEVFVVPYQDFLKDTPTIYSETSPAKAGTPGFKPKRQLDLTCLEPVHLLPVVREALPLIPFQPFFALPEVYLDILVPPESRV